MVDKIDGDYYYEKNVAYIRVTKILNSFPKPALYNWYAKYGLTECRKIMQVSRKFGTEMHKLIHANFRGDLQASQPDSKDKKMCSTIYEFMKWKKAKSPKPHRLEYSIINKDDAYGGTIDFIGNIEGVNTIIDWKSSAAVYDDYPLQLAAYLRAYNLMHPDENIEEGRVIVFRCDDDGNCKTIEEVYSAARLDDLYKVFLAVKAVHEYKYGIK